MDLKNQTPGDIDRFHWRFQSEVFTYCFLNTFWSWLGYESLITIKSTLKLFSYFCISLKLFISSWCINIRIAIIFTSLSISFNSLWMVFQLLQFLTLMLLWLVRLKMAFIFLLSILPYNWFCILCSSENHRFHMVELMTSHIDGERRRRSKILWWFENSVPFSTNTMQKFTRLRNIFEIENM